MGLREFKLGKWVPILSDKDGGFALIEKEALWNLKLAVVNGPEYQKTYWHEQAENDIYALYRYACSSLAEKLEDKALYAALIYDRFVLDHGCVAVVCSTLKTHKPPGQVKIRQLHCASNHFMKPGIAQTRSHSP